MRISGRTARPCACSSSEIPLTCPVRLLHGQRDGDVPHEISLRLAAALRSDDVQVALIKDGDHRLSQRSRHCPPAAHRRRIELELASSPPSSSPFAQASTADIDLSGFRQRTIEDDRLSVCLEQATSDPPTAILTANELVRRGQRGPSAAFPLQCLGMAYTRLLRWQAAEDAFLSARSDILPENSLQRAKLAAMAGNSRAGRRPLRESRSPISAWPPSTPPSANDVVLGGEIEIDLFARAGRARAERRSGGGARKGPPQRAAECRRLAAFGDARAARRRPQHRADPTSSPLPGLDRTNPAIGLEAGVIAALSGNDEAARKSCSR